MDPGDYLLIAGAGVLAAAINALAGGGPVLTLGAMSLIGIDPRIANLTSTVALCPGQLVAGYSGRTALANASIGRLRQLLGLSFAGGALGALLLILNSGAAFRALVPWLVLAATAVYAWNGLNPAASRKQGSGWSATRVQAALVPTAVYGGYFGGGNSFLVLALLGLAGLDVRQAGEVKNAQIAVVNLGAVMVFMVSGLVDWGAAAALAAGGLVGSIVGVRLLAVVPKGLLRSLVIGFGLFLSIWLFVA